MRKGPMSDSRMKGESDTGHCTCSDGQNEYFCKLCQSAVCKYCTSSTHKFHGCQLICEVAEEVRNHIQAYDPTKKTAEKMETVLNAQQLIQSMKKDLFASQADTIGKMDTRLDELHRELKEIRTNFMAKIQDAVKRQSEYLNKAERTLNKTAKSITTLIDAAKRLIDEQNNYDVVKNGISICDDIDEALKSDPIVPETDALSLEFYPGTADNVNLQEIFGKISIQSTRSADGSGFQKLAISTQEGREHQQKPSSKSEETSARQLPTTLVTGASGGAASKMTRISRVSVFHVDCKLDCVTCTTDDMCWYGGWSKNITLVDRTGREVRRQTLPSYCNGLTRSRDGTVYISCHNKSLYKLRTDDTMTDVKTCLTFYPEGLTCLPDTGELLVCGGKDGVFSVTGRGVQPALTDIKFSGTRDIAVNDRGDICVSDWGQKKVFIFDSHRRHVCTYTGHADMTRTMTPRGVTCDGRGGFIIADYYNKMLHVISRDGDNVMVYNTETDCDGEPVRLDMSQSGRLWVGFYVGFKVGHICVYDTT